MKLSVKVDYACRVLVHLAKIYQSDELAHIDDMARLEEVPANYLVQILSELRNGGLIVSRRGKQGGYALARAPEAISLLDIMEVIEGEMLELPPSVGGQSGRRVNNAWKDMRTTLETRAKAITLDKLMHGTEAMYYI
ncbi:MAG: Rrf2 family transcriptional regulator [Opitutaceae bacterium]|nr:Rrf2 family transcriptional regulator [Opitutaceae bacterium]